MSSEVVYSTSQSNAVWHLQYWIVLCKQINIAVGFKWLPHGCLCGVGTSGLALDVRMWVSQSTRRPRKASPMDSQGLSVNKKWLSSHSEKNTGVGIQEKGNLYKVSFTPGPAQTILGIFVFLSLFCFEQRNSFVM